VKLHRAYCRRITAIDFILNVQYVLIIDNLRRGKRKERDMENPEGSPASEQATPERIMQLGLGFWGSKTLLSAVEIGLFTELA
jgi:hypothetical protein